MKIIESLSRKGHVTIKVRMTSPANGEQMEAEALVDTGATFTVIPTSYADKLGLRPIRTRRVRTASGVEELDETFMVIEAEGERTSTQTLVNPKLDRILIGVLTLEALGLKVDPTKGKLEKAELLMM